MSANLLLIPLFLPILAGAISYFIPFQKNSHRNAYVMTTLCISAAFVWVLAIFPPKESLVLLQFADKLTFSLELDGAGRIFSCLSATLWPLTALYAFSYMSHEEHLPMFYCFFVMSFGATMGVAMADNMLTMYLFYELLSLFTIPLVMHGMGKKHNYAARKYMIYSIGGAAFAFSGVAFLMLSGANDFVFGGALNTLGEDVISQVLFLFSFFGFGVKAAIFPLHSWLPTASVAPTPVTALLHAVAVVKAGAFALIRLVYYAYGADLLQGTWMQYTVMSFALFTILYGSVSALRQGHFKRRLAYSTVSNLSYILFAVTLMTKASLVAAFCHLVFHSVIKIGAFFAAGSLLHNSNKEYLSQMEGVGRKMPLTFFFFGISALALTGIPPLNGFISKWYIATSAIEEGSVLAIIGVAVLLCSALLTGMYMFDPLVRAFFPRKGVTSELAETKEADWRMLIPMGICALLCLAMGLFSGGFLSLLKEVLAL